MERSSVSTFIIVKSAFLTVSEGMFNFVSDIASFSVVSRLNFIAETRPNLLVLSRATNFVCIRRRDPKEDQIVSSRHVDGQTQP